MKNGDHDMYEANCPHCGKSFPLDGTGVSYLIQQVRNEQFTKDVESFTSQINERYSSDLQLEIAKHDEEMQRLIKKYEDELKAKDEAIAYYKDFKNKLSTKGIGESLEQFCYNEFFMIKSLFPNADLIKDNETKEGTKGDFIYRELYEDGTEILSIMFEMKTENDTTATKHKNSDFFKKLNEDRNKKKCEYAVLVSMLEGNNDLYNRGIVDVSSDEYEKMYVIRPQCFIPMITILRNAALKTLDYKAEIRELREQQIDLFNFESNLEKYQESVNAKLQRAENTYDVMIARIEDSITELEKTKEALEKAKEYLFEADKKAKSITIKKLTKGAPSVEKQLESIRTSKDELMN